MGDEGTDQTRRQLLAITTGLGLAGTAVASIPFILSMQPSARARAAGAPVEVDISKLEAGQRLVVEWRGKPVWIVNRTKKMLDTLPAMVNKLVDPGSAASEQPSYTQNEWRSIKPEILVLVGICTHLGCSPLAKFVEGAASGLGQDWPGGFFCPCHGSFFDFAGRVYKDVPAPTNLVVPPHAYLSDTRIIVGLGPDEAEKNKKA
jgi:ubiquinol-cytochrome c reductase iron-sulfur subunit